MKLSKWQTFKVIITKFYKSKWKNRIVLSSLALIFALSIIVPIVIVLTKPKLSNYSDSSEVSLIERFDGSKMHCTEDRNGSGTYWCRRGPVIMSVPAMGSTASLLKFNLENFKDKNNKRLLEQSISINDLKNPIGNAINYINSWGILIELVNWFYENVAWGPEILSFNHIDIIDNAIRNFFNEIGTPSAAFSAQYYPKYIAGTKLIMPFFSQGSSKEINKYLETKNDEYNPILNRFDDFKFYLTQAYLTYKIGWYTQDRSTQYRVGGATERKENREILNRYSEFSYLSERFKNVNKKVNNITSYNLNRAHNTLDEEFKDEIKENNLNFINKGDKSNLTYLDLYAFANNDNNLTATKSFELNSEIEGNKINHIYDGIDYFSNVASELTIFQLQNTNVFNAIKEIEINFKEEVIKIGELNKSNLENYLKYNSIENLITSKIRFRGYKTKWVQNYFLYLLLPLILLNPDQKLKDIKYDYNYEKIRNDYHELKNKPDWALTSLKYTLFNDNEFETNDGFKRGLIDAPGFMSTTNYYNQLKFLVNRDLMLLTTDDNLFKKPNNKYIELKQRLNNPYFKDLNLLNNFGANPYQNKGVNNVSDEIMIDNGVINGLQKLLRMNSDVSMNHLSEDSERSYLWGYVNADQNVNSLKFTNTKTGENKYIKIWTQENLDKKYNCPNTNSVQCDQKQSLLGNEYIYKNESKLLSPANQKTNSKILLNDITSDTITKPKKLWVSNFAVIADYANAIFQGNYKVSFSGENDLQNYEINFDQKILDYGLNSNNENHILNSNSDIVAHAGWWFYRNDNDDKTIYFRVIGRSWLK